MKEKKLFKPDKRLLLVLFWMLFIPIANAQNNSSYLSWDQMVGCIDYDSAIDPKRNTLNLNEGVQETDCLRFCEYSSVNFIVTGNNIADVQWDITGGNAQSISGSFNEYATINWDNNGPGAITVIVTYTDETISSSTICVEKIISPEAKFEVIGSPDFLFCVNTPINFENLSNDNGGSDLIYYNWDFGDGNTSSAFEPTHSYDTPGYYEVILTVTNSCNCTSKYSVKVFIENKPNIDISCPSVVCEKDIATYTANEECSGEWNVIGGYIVGQNGNSIDVIWDSVDPEDGFGYVQYLSHCSCPFWTTVKVPVILERANIKGTETICLNSQAKYTLPQWPTTDFVWRLNGIENHPMLVYTDQRNEIIVDGSTIGTYTLTADYINTLLGCKGSASAIIKVINTVEIVNNNLPLRCSGINQSFTNNQNANVQWVISLNNNTVYTSNGASCIYNFPQGGTYSVVANANGCASPPVSVVVAQTPSQPAGPIQGDAFYCLNTPVIYSLPANTEPNSVYAWAVTGGTIQGSNSGSQITVIFTANNGTVKVKRVSTLGQICTSTELSKNVQKVTHNAVINHASNQVNFCPSSGTTFTANLQGVVYDNIEWSIVGIPTNPNQPETTNFGNVTNGTGGTTAQISFNEISGGVSNGQVRLTITKCGQTVVIPYNVTINQTPQLTINPISQVCAGENFTLSFNSSMPITSGTVKWTVNGAVFNGNTVTTNIDNISGANMSFPIVLEIINPNGCNFTATTSATVIVKPRPDIHVVSYNYSVCPTGSYSVTLQSNLGSGINSGLTYKWFKAPSLIPIGTGTSYTINNNSQGTPAGTYYLVVTNTNGCSTRTQNIIVTHNCSTPNPCNLNQTVTIDTNYTDWVSCNRINAKVNYTTNGGIIPTIKWYAPAQAQVDNDSSATTFFTTNVPGEYLLIVELNYNGCIVQKQISIQKNYQANFNYTLSCDDNGTYTAQLLNNSVFFNYTPNDSMYLYTYAGSNLTQNGSNATVTNLQPGQTYTFTLKISGGNGLPNCTKSVTVTIPSEPYVIFPIPAAPYCPENGIVLTIPGPGYNSDYTYKWEFNGTAYFASSTHTTVQIISSGPKTIKLTATNRYGCSFSHTETEVIYIPSVNFIGVINPENDYTVCEGSTIQALSYVTNPNTPSPANIIWMNGNTPVGQGNPFTPTTSGNYWPKLLNGDGCSNSDMAASPRNVTIKPLPYVNISGQNNVCLGSETTLYGTVTDTNLQHRWLRNGSPISGVLGNWTPGTANLEVPVSGNTPGTYTYRLEVQGGNSCATFKEFVVTVHPALPNITISYSVYSCSPYTLELTANGPANGTYNWSNGATGQTIYVLNGGAYSVTYIAPSGCTKTAQIQTPHNPERYLWVVPSGCYDVCPNTDPAPYLLGPLGVQQAYRWLINGNPVQTGTNTNVPNLPITAAGGYQLSVQNGQCVNTSATANIMFNPKDCDIPICEFKFKITKIQYKSEGNFFVLSGMFVNTTANTVTVNLSSFNNYGTFDPAVITVGAGQSYTFAPLRFYPNSSYPIYGGMDMVVLSTYKCTDLFEIEWPPLGENYMMMMQTTNELTLEPNPAVETTTVHYKLGSDYKQAQQLVVYDVLGNIKFVQKLNTNEGNVLVPVANWTTGIYVVSLEADNQRVMQQKLIKK